MMRDRKDEFSLNQGWSSGLFYKTSSSLIPMLESMGVTITIGRTVIHLEKGEIKLKAYVHHNGRSKEFCTITDAKGAELITIHYNEQEQLTKFLQQKFQ